MERLWAPWRLQYVAGERSDNCIFCDKPLLGNDKEAHIVFRGKLAYVMLNTFPYNNGHVMVAPFAHLSAFEDLPEDTLKEMFSLAQQCVRAFKLVLRPDGVNIGLNLGAAAGAGIKDHVHMHLVPRWEGDTNFMPVLADVRVIPQALDDTYEQLAAAFSRLTPEEPDQAKA